MLQIKNVELTIGNNPILKNISFDVKSGEILSIIGPSGCGKSSILKTIVGIHKGITGSVLLNGKNIVHEQINARNITLVFQNYSLFPNMNTLENMHVGSKDKEKNDYILERMCITHLKEKYPHEMSGGEQQRVAIARAITHQPKILLLDEPFSNIDAITTRTLRKTVMGLIKEYNLTTIMVTHDLDDVFEMSDRCVVMDEGKVIQFSDLHTMYQKPKNEFVAKLFGEIIEYNNKKYRVENIKLCDMPASDTVKGAVVNVKFKAHYNELLIKINQDIQITVYDYNRTYTVMDLVYITFGEFLGEK